MRELDAKLDNKPTVEAVKRIVELRIRNILVFRELAEYNNKGVFLFKHPLIRQYTVRMELINLLRKKPDAFLEEYGNCKNNVARYSSYLNRKNKSQSQEEKWKENLKRHEERLELITSILKDEYSNSLQSKQNADSSC